MTALLGLTSTDTSSRCDIVLVGRNHLHVLTRHRVVHDRRAWCRRLVPVQTASRNEPCCLSVTARTQAMAKIMDLLGSSVEQPVQARNNCWQSKRFVDG